MVKNGQRFRDHGTLSAELRTQSIFGDTVYSCYGKFRLD